MPRHSAETSIALCADCGLDYSRHGVDLFFPNDQWNNLIAPPDSRGILLCGVCTMRRIAKIDAAILCSRDNHFGRRHCLGMYISPKIYRLLSMHS